MRKKRLNRTKGILLALLGGASLAVYLAGGVLAVHDEGFQLEGNVQSNDLSFVDHDLVGNPPKEVDTSGTLTGNRAGKYDWAGPDGLFNNDGSEKALVNGFVDTDFERDFKTNANGVFLTSDDTTFATGSKDGLPISGWQCNQDNNVNSKIDIANGYAAVFDAPFNNPPDTTTPTHRFLVFGMEKDVDNGSNNIGIWLLKDNTVGCSSSGAAKTFSGAHTAGDVLIVSAFSKGGGVSTINAYKWVDDIDPKKAGNQPGVDPNPVAASADCLDVSESGTTDQICATINGQQIQVPWPTVQDSVAAASNGTINVPNFVEGGIDLTALKLDEGSGQCFNRFIMDTRSSPSIPANLFDYVQGNLQTCKPKVAMTKTPSQTDVCSSAKTEITYSYKVDNTGNVAITNGKIVDDHGTPADTSDDVTITVGSIPAGGTTTVTSKATITTTTTNTAVFTGDTIAGVGSATTSATAKVTAHNCAITVTKTPSQTDVCSSAKTLITYTYVVTNTGDVDLTNVKVSDDTLSGAQAAFEAANGGSTTLKPGAANAVTFTLKANITQTTTNKVDVQGDAFGLSPAATASATAKVTANPCATSQLAPTTTTCQQFRDGTAGIENVVNYGVKSNKINNVSPGVLFYYTKFQLSTGGTVVVHLTQTMGDSLPFFGVQSVQVFTGTCGTVSGATINTSNPADVTITLTGVTAGDTFIANIKIDPGTIVGSPAPSPTTVNFSYATVVGGNTLTSAAGTIVKTH